MFKNLVLQREQLIVQLETLMIQPVNHSNLNLMFGILLWHLLMVMLGL